MTYDDEHLGPFGRALHDATKDTREKKMTTTDGANLNTKEKAVLAAFPAPKADGPYTEIGELAKKAFPKKGTAPKTKGNSWVRNSLRKLLRLKLIEQEKPRSGRYRRALDARAQS